MDKTEIIILIIVAIVFQYAIIYYAVYNSHEKERYYQQTMTRFMIKKMLKEGFTRQEIVDMMAAKENDFWNSIGQVDADENVSYLEEMKRQLK